MIFKKIAEKLNIDKNKKSTSAAINPIDVNFEQRESIFLNKLTRNAVKLYEREKDIRNFSKLVLSDPENTSHIDMVNELEQQGIINLTDDEKPLELSDNKRFLRDLGLE